MCPATERFADRLIYSFDTQQLVVWQCRYHY
jgi:hypothetical protein